MKADGITSACLVQNFRKFLRKMKKKNSLVVKVFDFGKKWSKNGKEFGRNECKRLVGRLSPRLVCLGKNEVKSKKKKINYRENIIELL